MRGLGGLIERVDSGLVGPLVGLLDMARSHVGIREPGSVDDERLGGR